MSARKPRRPTPEPHQPAAADVPPPGPAAPEPPPPLFTVGTGSSPIVVLQATRHCDIEKANKDAAEYAAPLGIRVLVIPHDLKFAGALS